MSANQDEHTNIALTHLDERGHAHMVDVTPKPVSVREAEAVGVVSMRPATLALILSGELPKGDVLAVARVAGIMAAKRTSELIPLCHALPLSAAEVECRPIDGVLEIRARVRTEAKTGVEMEALTAVTIAALTVYDMCKAVDRGMRIEAVRLARKSGGRSGSYREGD